MRAWSPEHELAWHRIYFRAQSGSSAVVPCAHTRPLPHIPGAAFAFALGRDPWSYLALSPHPGRRICFRIGQDLGGGLYPPSPSLTPSRHHVCSVRILGGGAVYLLAPSRTLSVPCLLSWDPWWWRRAPARPLPCTPGATVPRSPSLAHSRHWVCSVGILGGGTMCPLALTHTLPAPRLLSRSVGMLGGDALCPLAFSHALLALHLLSRLVRKLGGGAVYPSSPPLVHSNTLLMQRGWTGEKKPTSEGHLPPLERRARTGQDNKRKKASNEHSRIVEHRVRNWSRQ
jgi:hypothetical protein